MSNILYGTEVDMWSLGAVAYLLVTGNKLISEDDFATAKFWFNVIQKVTTKDVTNIVIFLYFGVL